MKAIAANGIFRSRNNVKRLKIPKNKPENPELSNASTTATYTAAISIIYSSVSENKQEESIQSNMSNTSTAATATISTPESSIDFDVEKKSPVSLNVKLKTKKVINRNRNKQNFHLTLPRSESYFSLFLLCK